MAEFGVIGLETVFPVINTYNREIPLEELIEKITTNPRDILRLQNPTIEEGQKANLTVFSTNDEWTYEEKNIVSKSKNSPFVGSNFIGKVIKVIV